MVNGSNGIRWTHVRSTSSISSLQSVKVNLVKDILKFQRIYKELDERLSKSSFLAGEEYSIADIATFPWIARHEWHDIGLKNFKGLSRWYEEISSRDAVQRGYDLLNRGDQIPNV